MRKHYNYDYSLALEEQVNGIEFLLIETNDPVAALAGGALACQANDYTLGNGKKWLLDHEHDENIVTNNPSLIEEVKKFCTARDGLDVIVFSNELKKTLSNKEYEAIKFHELGHLYHEHLQKQMAAKHYGTFSHATFMRHEKEADAYAAKHFGPDVMLSAFEKAMEFGQKYSLTGIKESSPVVKHLLSINVLNELSLKFLMYLSRLIWKDRINALEYWKKHGKQENE